MSTPKRTSVTPCDPLFSWLGGLCLVLLVLFGVSRIGLLLVSLVARSLELAEQGLPVFPGSLR